jgi:hypothetical protein
MSSLCEALLESKRHIELIERGFTPVYTHLPERGFWVEDCVGYARTKYAALKVLQKYDKLTHVEPATSVVVEDYELGQCDFAECYCGVYAEVSNV